MKDLIGVLAYRALKHNNTIRMFLLVNGDILSLKMYSNLEQRGGFVAERLKRTTVVLEVGVSNPV